MSRQTGCHDCQEFDDRIRAAKADGRTASVGAWRDAKALHLKTDPDCPRRAP